MQSSCLELEERRSGEVKDAKAVAESKKREEELRQQGCRAVA